MSKVTPLAKQCADVTARKFFDAKGDPESILFDEKTLALLMSAAVQVGMTMVQKRLEKEFAE